MAHFQSLTTGAVTQYPSSRKTTYSTHVTNFVDGTEQRFRELNQPVRTWIIRLHQLSAEEIAALETFFEIAAGAVRSPFSSSIPGMAQSIPRLQLRSGYLPSRRTR